MTAAELLVLARVVKDTLWARLWTEAPRLAAGVLEVVPALAAQAEAHRLEIVRLDGELARLVREVARLRPVYVAVEQLHRRGWRRARRADDPQLLTCERAVREALDKHDAALAKETP